MFLQDEVPMAAGQPVVEDRGVFRIEARVDDRRVLTKDDDQECLSSLGKRITGVIDEVLGHSGFLLWLWLELGLRFRCGLRLWLGLRLRNVDHDERAIDDLKRAALRGEFVGYAANVNASD